MNALIHLVFRKVSTEITNICILNLDVDSIMYINILQLKQNLFFRNKLRKLCINFSLLKKGNQKIQNSLKIF